MARRRTEGRGRWARTVQEIDGVEFSKFPNSVTEKNVFLDAVKGQTQVEKITFVTKKVLECGFKRCSTEGEGHLKIGQIKETAVTTTF